MYLSQPGFPGNEPYRPRRYRSLYYQCTTTTPAAAIGKMHNVSENFQQKRPVFRLGSHLRRVRRYCQPDFPGRGRGAPLFLWKQHERDRDSVPVTARAKPHADARTPRRPKVPVPAARRRRNPPPGTRSEAPPGGGPPTAKPTGRTARAAEGGTRSTGAAGRRGAARDAGQHRPQRTPGQGPNGPR